MAEEIQKDENNIQEVETGFAQRPERHHSRTRDRGKFFALRNLLNIIFIIGAIVGMIIYFFHDAERGMIIVLGAMAFKMCECVIRLVK